MNNLFFSNTLRFIGLVLLQVLVLNNVNLFGYLNPLVYISWVFLFPVRKNQSNVLILSFLLGLTVDIFYNSGGINAAATLFIALIKLPLLKVILKKSDFDYLLFNIRSISFGKAFILIFVLTITHHFIVFSLVYFSFSEFYTIISTTFFTSIFTIILCILGIVLFTNKK